MGWWLSLIVDRKEVEHLQVPYSYTTEAHVLEEVFPGNHWSMENPEANDWYFDTSGKTKGPPPFDFVANEEKARETMREYGDLVTDTGEYAMEERQAEFVKDFWRAYNLGLILQRAEMTPRVSIG